MSILTEIDAALADSAAARRDAELDEVNRLVWGEHEQGAAFYAGTGAGEMRWVVPPVPAPEPDDFWWLDLPEEAVCDEHPFVECDPEGTPVEEVDALAATTALLPGMMTADAFAALPLPERFDRHRVHRALMLELVEAGLTVPEAYAEISALLDTYRGPFPQPHEAFLTRDGFTIPVPPEGDRRVLTILLHADGYYSMGRWGILANGGHEHTRYGPTRPDEDDAPAVTMPPDSRLVDGVLITSDDGPWGPRLVVGPGDCT